MQQTLSTFSNGQLMGVSHYVLLTP